MGQDITKASKPRPPPDYLLEDAPRLPAQSISPHRYNATAEYRSANAIVMDLGSSALRAGFSTMPDPSVEFPPMVARLRDQETGLRTFFVGHDALISSARSTARPAYESGIPNNPALLERLLDGALVHLGLAEQDTISHRFVFTEAPCQPNSARALIMELVFEAYLSPSVCFGIDALFSYMFNRRRKSNSGELSYACNEALVLSCGYQSTHVLPISDGSLVPSAVKRINIGGWHMTDQLTRRLQLLHPDHAPLFTTSRVELLKERVCYVSSDYDNELNRLKADTEFYNSVSKSVKIPSTEAADKPPLSPGEQERLRQARVENGRRLSELMREKRRSRASTGSGAGGSKDRESGNDDVEGASFTEEEVAPLYQALSEWYDLQKIMEVANYDEDDYYVALLVRKVEPAKFSATLDERAAKLDAERANLPAAKARSAEEAWWKRLREDELLSMPDADLSATELKRKRHVRSLRGAAEARERARRVKEKEKAEAARKEEELRKMRDERPQEYLTRLREERRVLAGRIKKRDAAREAGSDRRSQAARERMRLLAQHAGNKASVEEPGRGRGRNRTRSKGRGRGRTTRVGKKSKTETEEEDTFGWNDSDWDVYRAMKVGAESDSDDNSAEERDRLSAIRDEIHELAPDEVDPTVSHPEGVALLYEENKYSDEIDVVVDRLRTGELLMQPTLAGVEQCGLAEAIWLSSSQRSSVVKEVFITGGVGRMQGLKERIGVELRRLFPIEMGDDITSGLRVAEDPLLDAWRGAALFAEAAKDQFASTSLSKADYDECGAGYLKEHAFGNRYFPTPILSAADLELKKKMQKQASKRGKPRGLFAQP